MGGPFTPSGPPPRFTARDVPRRVARNMGQTRKAVAAQVRRERLASALGFQNLTRRQYQTITNMKENHR